MEMNSAGNYIINAANYLDILDKKSSFIKKEQDNFNKKISSNPGTPKISNETRSGSAYKNSNVNKNISDTDFLVQE